MSGNAAAAALESSTSRCGYEAVNNCAGTSQPSGRQCRGRAPAEQYRSGRVVEIV